MRLAEIETRISDMRELLEIVGAMRSLAGMRRQEAHKAGSAIRRYAEMITAVIGNALVLLPEPEVSGRPAAGRRALILCTAEHGFVGSYNTRLIDAAAGSLEPGDGLFVLGSRGRLMVRERGWPTAWSGPMATRPQGVPEAVRALRAELYPAIARGHVARVDVMFTRHPPGGGAAVEGRQLLPIEPASFARHRSRPLPLHNLDPGRLFEKLVADYVFARLAEAVIEALASENAARFAAMAAAHDNISNKLGELRQEARLARQNEITMELLDLATGAEALAAPAQN